MKKKHPLWFKDLTVEHNPDNFQWEIWDRKRSEIVGTFNDDYLGEDSVWKILRKIAKRINRTRLQWRNRNDRNIEISDYEKLPFTFQGANVWIKPMRRSA